MSEETPIDRARENATGIVSMLVTGIWMFGLFTGQEWWLPALIVGYAVFIPLTATLFGDEDERETWAGDLTDSSSRETTDERTREPESDDETALEALRRRYAEGELTDEQFERKLDRLLETETLEDVEEYRERASQERERELE
ncbi:SHOCT domain-containing protein [Halomicrobium mukohataei]|uniref:SHOCT domain-containing protein n=1 Tax=Halomicrobium mukohataei TaxID=57705 RepID=A0A847UFQ1_9EURY|nr:SHOCT domain-containing protein [Halomicrobium mukohataei]NLV09971.1 SHOCT domain-containing protein [Halomicrobium mukohataei]